MTMAVLGFDVQSQSAVAAKQHLNDLTGASKHAQAATDALNAASKRSSSGSTALAQATNMVTAAQNKAAAATKANTVALAAQQRMARAAMNNSRQLSFQLIDIGQALATAPTMGIYALQNLGFQVAQIGQLYMGRGGFNQAIKDSAAQVGVFAARMGPLALVVGGVGAAFAGLTYEIDKSTKTSVSFGDVALAAFQMARDGINDLLLPAVQAIAPTVSSVWEYVVQETKAGINFLHGYYVGGFRAIRELWSKFPEIMGDVAIQAANGVIAGIELMINSSLDGIKRLISEIPEWLLPEAVEKFAQSRSNVDLGGFNNPFAGAAAGVGDAFGSGFDPAFADGLFSGLRSRAIANANRPTKDQLKEAKRQAEAYKDMVRSSEQFIAAKELEARTIGMTEEAAARLRYEQELMNKAANDNITLSAKQKEELSGLAAGMAAAEAATKKIKDAFEFARDTTKGFFSDISQGLRNGEGLWKSFADAASNALDRITDKLLNQVIDALFQVNSVGMSAGGGGGGIFSALLGGIGSIFGFANGGYTGGGSASSVAGVVHGGEYVFSKSATDRIGVGNLDNLHRRAKGYAQGGYVPAMANQNNGMGGEIHVHLGGTTINGSGLSEQELARVLESRDKRIMAQIPDAVNQAKRRAKVA